MVSAEKTSEEAITGQPESAASNDGSDLRLLAFCIDFGLLFFFEIVLWLLEKAFNLADFYPYLWIPYTLFALWFLFRDVLPGQNGQSPGKKWVGIQVVMAEDRSPATGNFGVGLSRNLPLVIPFLNFFEGISLNQKPLNFRRRGDLWGKTMVIKKDS